MHETQYEALRRQGITRRSFLQFCSLTAASLGLGTAGAQEIAQAMQTKPRMPVVWLHGLECTCCTESFIRSYHPVAKDLVLSMISLDYDDSVRIYDVEFYAGDYEYEFEINARTGAIYDYDKDYRWDD